MKPRDANIVIPSFTRGEEDKPLLSTQQQRLVFEYSKDVTFQLVAVGIQFLSGLFITIFVLTGIWKDIAYPMTASIPVWNEEEFRSLGEQATFRDNVIVLKNVSVDFNIYVAWTIVGFFWASALFELGAAYLIGLKNPPEEEKENTPEPAGIYYMERIYTLRFLEYSMTASAMLVTIAAQVGIWDWRTLSSISGLSAVCMLCGILGEGDIEKNYKSAVMAFIIGSVSFVFAWIPILWTFFRSRTAKTPPIVTGIVISEFILWLLFALVQLVQIVRKLRSETVLPWYLFLSVLSKGLLGWLTVSQVLAN